MSQRHDFLKQLLTDYECPESWEAMQGGDGCRFCGSCQKNVLNFERMTPRQIRSRLEAGRGQVCARLSRDGGVLRTIAEAAPAPRRRQEHGVFGWRPSPLAATLLGAFLGVGAAAAQAPSPPVAADASSVAASQQRRAERPPQREKRASGAAFLSGRVVDDQGRSVPGATVVARQVPGGREHRVVSGGNGRFVFERLPAGIYDLTAEIEGFEVGPLPNLLLEAGTSREADLLARPIAEFATMGIVMMPRPGLRELYDQSELVVAAVVEDSEILSVDERHAEVATRLIIERRIKGTVKERRVIYRHSEYLGSADKAGKPPGGFESGDEVLGFLVAAPDGEGAAARLTFETVDFIHGLRRLEGSEREAYLERLEDLARLERGARRRGSFDSAELMDWLVETAENPVTRGEAIDEIAQALWALESLAKEEGLEPAELGRRLQEALDEARENGESSGNNPDRHRSLFLGAAFSELHRQRLIAALMATESLTDADRTLFGLVRDWDRKAALSWAVKGVSQVGPAEPDEPYGRYQWMLELAEARAAELAGDSPEGKAAALFAESAEARWEELGEMPLENLADHRLLGERRLVLLGQLMAELAALLEGRP